MLKTENIFPLDLNADVSVKRKKDCSLEDLDNLVVNPDRVIRQELFTNYSVAVKADLKKTIPGQLTRTNYLALQQRINLEKGNKPSEAKGIDD